MRQFFVAILTMMALTSPVDAQGLGQDLFQLKDGFVQQNAKTEVTAALAPTKQAGVVTLQVKLVLPPGANTYSQDPDLPKPTRITVDLPQGWKAVDAGFTPDPKPKKSFDETFGQEMEKFYGTVVFSRRYAVPAGVNPQAATLSGKINFLVCDKDSCRPQTDSFEARYVPGGLKKQANAQSGPKADPSTQTVAKPVGAEQPSAEKESSLAEGYRITPKRSRRGEEVADPVQLQFELVPEGAHAGEIVTLAITMTLEDNWSTYGLEKASEDQIEAPTVITFQPENLEAVGTITSHPEPEVHTTKFLDEVVTSNAHEHQVTWQQQFRVVSDAPYGVSGKIRYQICETGKTCMPAHTVSFGLGTLQTAADVADARPIPQSYVQAGSGTGSGDEAAADDLASFSVETTGQDMSMTGAFVGAFLAGLIMNVLPCVLPVLAIKILSLVQQAGQHRIRVIALNLAYTLGVMAVFMVFAVLSWGLGNSIGSVFQNQTFMIVMACVVFLMGLSLFGVFELPVPGIIPSAAHHHEGFVGAFNTGIIATILGTPCIGPFIAPVFTWGLTQPAPVVFAMFGMMGLGMASPFLVAGFFPALVNWLPRPGEWMVRFKQFTGFVLMGTVIWLLFSVDMVWRVPVLVLLLALGMLVWMSANFAPPTASFLRKLAMNAVSLAVAAPVFVFGLWMMQEFKPVEGEEMHISKMPWQEFSEEQIVKLRNEGRPMLIDFTANWCVVCKVNEKVALDRDETVKFVKEHGFVPLLADFTNDDPEILKWLRRFGQDSVPLTIIVPPGKGSEIIALRGSYTQSTLLEKLQDAVNQSQAQSSKTGSFRSEQLSQMPSGSSSPDRSM